MLNKQSSFIFFISILLLVIVAFNQPLTINSNDAITHCQDHAPLLAKNLDPYIEENISYNDPPFNYHPVLIPIVKGVCSEIFFQGWETFYPFLLIINALLALKLFSYVSKDSLFSIVFYLTACNAFYLTYKSGNLSSFSFSFFLLSFYLFINKKFSLAGFVYGFFSVFRLFPYLVPLLLLLNWRKKSFRDFSFASLSTFLFTSLYSFTTNKDLFLNWANRTIFDTVVPPTFLQNISNSKSISPGYNSLDIGLLSVLNDISDHATIINFGNYIYQKLGIVFLLIYALAISVLIINLLLLILKQTNWEEEKVFLFTYLLFLSINFYFNKYYVVELTFVLGIIYTYYEEIKWVMLLIFGVVIQILVLLDGFEILVDIASGVMTIAGLIVIYFYKKKEEKLHQEKSIEETY